MSRNTLSITDNRTGKSYEVPITDETIRALDSVQRLFAAGRPSAVMVSGSQLVASCTGCRLARYSYCVHSTGSPGPIPHLANKSINRVANEKSRAARPFPARRATRCWRKPRRR